MKYFFFLSLLFTLNIKAESKNKVNSNFIWINSSRIEPFDFDTFLLTNFRGNHLELICSGNPFYGNKNSYIKYKNIYGIHVKDFLFKEDFTCHMFKNFLNSTFSAVNENNLVKIQLNRKTGYVEKVLLPDLDVYENGDSFYTDKEGKELANI